MKQQFRLLAALAAALIAILATGNALADMPDNTFGTVGTAADGSYLVEVGRGVSVTRVVDYYDKIYREATKNDDEPNGEPLTWGVIHAENEGRVIPYCSHPKNGPKWLPTRSTMVWNECDESDRSIILIAGPSGRIKVPVKSVESFAQMQARLVELDAFVKSLGCKRSDVSCLKSKVGNAPSTPPTVATPPVAKKPSAASQTPAELKADNERLTEANEILAGSITELTKKFESLKGVNERLAKTNDRLEERSKDLQGRPSLGTVYAVAGVSIPGLLIVGFLIGFGLMGKRRPKVAPIVLKDPPRPMPAVETFTERQLNERVRMGVEAVVLKKTAEANTVNQQLAATSAAAILAETKKREAAEARVKELEPSKKALDKILDAIGLADAAYSTLAFADSIPNAFGRSLIPQDRPVEDPGAREKLRDKFAVALKGVYDALGLALHRDGDFVASLFNPPKGSVSPTGSQAPPTSAVPSSGGGFERQKATLPGGLRAQPLPKIDPVDHGSEDSGAHAPFSDPVGEAALAAHTGSLAQAVAEPKTITIPYGVGVDAPPSMDGHHQAPVPGNGAATAHPEPSDGLEPGRVSLTPTLRPEGLPSEPPSS